MALLEVKNLAISFVTRMGTNKAVDGISFSVETGKITAIIGESGSGKSVACYSMLGLVPMPPGRIDGGTAVFANNHRTGDHAFYRRTLEKHFAEVTDLRPPLDFPVFPRRPHHVRTFWCVK